MQKIILTILIMSILLLAVYLSIIMLKDNKEDCLEIEKNKRRKKSKNRKKVKIKIGKREYTVLLEENATVNELYEKLPLEMNMEDLNQNKKFFYLDSKFTVEPKIFDKINIGDIMMYKDNCLVIFYETCVTSFDLTKIGNIEDTNDLKKVLGTDKVKVKIYKDTNKEDNKSITASY